MVLVAVCLPGWIQSQLTEGTMPVRELAARINKLQWKAAAAAMVAEIAAMAQNHPAKKQWTKKKPGNRKPWRSRDGNHGSALTAKRKLESWVAMGICKFHYQ